MPRAAGGMFYRMCVDMAKPWQIRLKASYIEDTATTGLLPDPPSHHHELTLPAHTCQTSSAHFTQSSLTLLFSLGRISRIAIVKNTAQTLILYVYAFLIARVTLLYFRQHLRCA